MGRGIEFPVGYLGNSNSFEFQYVKSEKCYQCNTIVSRYTIFDDGDGPGGKTLLTINNYLVQLGLMPYHLDWIVSEFASSNCAFYIRYGENTPFTAAINDHTGSFPRLTSHHILNHLIGRVRIAIRAAPILKYFSINLLCSKEQLLIYLNNSSPDFGVPLIIVTKKSRLISCYYFLQKREEKKRIIDAVEYSLEKLLDPEIRQLCKTFPGSEYRLEIPFGPGSCILDSTTLEPMKMKRRSMIELFMRSQRETTLTLDTLLCNV